MNPARYLDYLRSKFVLNEEDKEEIEYEKTRKQKASVMIDILLRKGGNAYDVFVKAIQVDRTQTDLVRILHTEYEKRRNNYFALVRGPATSRIHIDDRSLPKPAPPPRATTDSGPPENIPPEHDHVPPPITKPLLSAQPGRKRNLLQIGSQQKACHDPTVSSEEKEAIYYRDRPEMARPAGAVNHIPSAVHEIEHRDIPSSARQVEDTETESMKEKKEQTNRHKLKFTSRSADNAEIDPDQETHRKECLREGEEHTESLTTGSLISADSTKLKEIM
ncbi:zinc finger CCCH domain-containing protein 4-like isoform X2 [Mizuhopecten yessoensis]|nr:zinc finger CCCH domain-containing protein 4-like isoform X2 [Mizuhopecten yessoensis]